MSWVLIALYDEAIKKMTNLISRRLRPNLICNRRIFLAGLSSGVALSPIAGQASGRTQPASKDEKFMAMALNQAREADYPFGCVITRDDEVIARGGNIGVVQNDPTAHGEMTAIRDALRQHGGKRLAGATLYTTGEPCAMCMGAIIWCGITRVVYALSIEQLSEFVDQIMVSSDEIAARTAFASVSITGGVLADETRALFVKAHSKNAGKT